MKINIQSVNFKADQKLIDFAETKMNKLVRYYDRLLGVEITLKAEKPSIRDNKMVEVRLEVPGNDIVLKEYSNTFEDAINKLIPTAKTTLTKHKEKMRKK